MVSKPAEKALPASGSSFGAAASYGAGDCEDGEAGRKRRSAIRKPVLRPIVSDEDRWLNPHPRSVPGLVWGG